MVKNTQETPDRGSKLVSIPTVFVSDSLHFETVYLALRLTDAFRLVGKKEQLIHSAIQCLSQVVTDAAEMGLLRKECALYEIKVDPDKKRAQSDLQKQLAEIREQHKTLKTLLSAVKEASESPRMFTPKEFEAFSPDSVKMVLASLNGKAVRFEDVDAGLEFPIETSDPRVVTGLISRRIGHPIIVD
ncbi:MAG TPA: hypothetical protein VEG65_00470 [Candidatus Bathyarchaeia archaeon]|nr:hypothetical protein [Candidatus Bathyarchaeia archaeon]